LGMHLQKILQFRFSSGILLLVLAITVIHGSGSRVIHYHIFLSHGSRIRATDPLPEYLLG
jgi:hypothetical protein